MRKSIRRAVDLISTSRLDIAAKTLLAKSYENGFGLDFSREVYRATLTAMHPLGKFGEDDVKFSLEDYEIAFHKLYVSMKDRGFDANLGSIPLSRDGTLQNGAHRVAIGTILGLDVEVEQTHTIPQVYDYRFFRTAGLEIHFLRRLAWEFLNLNSNVRAILLSGFTDAEGLRIADDVAKTSDLLCHEPIDLTEIGKRRLMDAAYGHLDWYSSSLREKLVLERFGANSNAALILYLDRVGSGESNLKERLRNSYVPAGQLDRRIHGSDNYEETLQLARCFLLKGQRLFLNWAPLGAEIEILERARTFQDESKFDSHAIDGGAVAEIFGIRKTNDLDHICTQREGTCKFASRNGDCHNRMYFEAGFNCTEILRDPDSTFLVQGVRFVSAEWVARAKRFRGDEKDILDSAQLEKIEEGSVNLASAFSTTNSASRARKWKRRSQIMIMLDKLLALLPRRIRQLVAELAALVRGLRN